MDVEYVLSLDGLTSYLSKIKVAPGFLVLTSSPGVDGNGLSSLYSNLALRLLNEEQTSWNYGRALA